MNLDELYEKLNERRRYLGMTYRELQAESGYTWSTISKWFKHKRDMRLLALFDLLQVLGLRIRLELDDDDEREERRD
jgi:transcriptional regulator with XRE-family HTH domain